MLTVRLAFLTAYVVTSTSPAQSPASPARLLRDLDTRFVESPSSRPDRFVRVGSWCYFVADDGVHGREIFRTGGTPQSTSMVVDLIPGPAAPMLRKIVPFGSRALIFGMSDTRGDEPWITDGTAAGTRLLANIVPAGYGSYPVEGVSLSTRAIFFAYTGATGTEPWSTDGTEAGTVMLADINPGNMSSHVQSGFRLVRTDPLGREKLYFLASKQSQLEIWETDGTPPGTQRAFAFSTWCHLGPPAELAGGDYVFASCRADFNPWRTELFRTDLTQNGTVSLGIVRGSLGASARPVSFDGRVWYGWTEGSACASTDGTAAGTRTHQVRGLATPPEHVALLGAHDGSLWAIGRVGSGDRVLRLDAGTDEFELAFALPFLVSGRVGGYDVEIPSSRGIFFVRGDFAVGGLWAVDVANLSAWRVAGAGDADPIQFGNRAVFSFDTETPIGIEPGATDGTASGTIVLRDVNPIGPESPTLGSAPRDFTEFGQRAVFLATTATGTDLWITDGTAVGTIQLTSGVPNILFPTVCGDRLFFASRVTPLTIYVSDGTPAGTRAAITIPSGSMERVVSPFAPMGNDLLMYVYGPMGLGVYVTDGTNLRALSTEPQQILGPRIPRITTVGATAFFFTKPTNPTSGPYRLWSTDGTPSGTTPLADLSIGAFMAPVAAFRDRFWFIGYDLEGSELWSSDGTTVGTGRVTSLIPGNAQIDVQQLIATDTHIYVLTRSESWACDGGSSAAVTLPVTTGVGMQPITTFGRYLVFGQAIWGPPWITDGTVAGSHALAGLRSPLEPDMPFVAAGSRNFLFGTVDRELWFSDGTVGGTRFHQDLALSTLYLASRPMRLAAAVAGRTVFAALHPSFGDEPFVFDSGADVQTVGTGCGRGTRMPQLFGTYEPTIDEYLRLDGRAPAGGLALVMVSLAPISATPAPGLGSCLVRVDPLFWTALGEYPIVAQHFATAVALPGDPATFGLQVMLQAAYGPTDSPSGFDLSNGLLVTLGL